MRMQTKVLIGVGTLVAVVGAALATPIVGLTSPLLSIGKQNADMEAHGRARTASGQRFHVEFESEGPAALTTQIAALGAGGQNGWHSHPGMVVVTVLSGSITWYDENCVPTNYKAGDSWVEGDKVHSFKITSTGSTQLAAWFITAQGQPLRTDEAAPACAAALGL